MDKKLRVPSNPTENETSESGSNPRPKLIFVNLPFLQETSQKVQGSILGFLKKFDPDHKKFKVIFVDKCCKLRDCFKFKDRTPNYLASNCVYKLNCSCGLSYVGQTERNIYLRMEEHSKTQGSGLSAVGHHLADNPDHTVDFQNPEILGHSTNIYKRLVKEALFIQQHNPELNVQSETRKLYLFNV